ncbi:MAG: sulfotransferase family protein [Lysobacteraceae bacterium]
MSLKVIGAGFGRTGTMSAYTALNQLGFPCYHMVEVLQNKANASHLDFWRKVANAPAGMQHDWERVFANYSAAVDNPACCVWRELLVAYPDAKVLLTLHPGGADAWYDSTMDTIYFTESMWQFKVLEIATPFGRKFGDMSHKLIWQRSHRGTMDDRAKAIAYYRQHIADVKAAVPPDRLLVFTVNEGWKPLCDFLGVPIPETPFPNVNDRASIKKVLKGMTRGAYVILGIGAAVIAGIVYGALRFLH